MKENLNQYSRAELHRVIRILSSYCDKTVAQIISGEEKPVNPSFSIKQIEGLEDRLLTIEENVFGTNINTIESDKNKDVYLFTLYIDRAMNTYENKKYIEEFSNKIKSKLSDSIVITIPSYDKITNLELIKRA